MNLRLAAVASLTAVVAMAPSVAAAQGDPEGGRDALPSLVRVGVAGDVAPGVAMAATGGWAFTEAQDDGDGSHHRLGGTLAGALSATEWLSFALRLEGRYDSHPDGDDGWLGAPTLAARAGSTLGSLRLGAEAALTVPGESFPSLAFDAPVVDLRALAGVDLEPVLVAAHLGYRIDQSANAIDEPQRLTPGDRLAIGLSDFDALLVGLGVGYRLGATTLMAEATWDLLLGDGAPGATTSPLRVSAGARYRATERLSLELVVDVSPSSREILVPEGPLYPVEPRLGVWAGARWQLPFAGEDRVAVADADTDAQGPEETAPPDETEPPEETAPPGETEPPEPAEALPSGELRGLVRSFNGRPVDARVTVEPLGAQAQTDQDGFFEIDVPPGSYEVVIEASGYSSQRRQVTVEENGVTILNADLRRARRR